MKKKSNAKKNHPYHTLIHTFCINMAASWKYLGDGEEIFHLNEGHLQRI